MLTPEQEKWVSHLRNDDQIVIKPFDPSCDKKFDILKESIQSKLGKNIDVIHRGATSLGISGQDEIDTYIPVLQGQFNDLLEPLTELFGKPRSCYDLERARFVTEIDGKHVDVFLMNRESRDWRNGVIFENYLKQHPKALVEYKKLKEDGNGLSGQEYYRRKIEFINMIVNKANNID